MNLLKSNLYKDIRFWIILFFLVRMYGITFPPLEVAHNWRQTDGMMVARNFYEHDANILFPAVDVAGNRTGIVGCEFPILNYSVYIVAKIFGYQHWYGRLIVLIISCFGAWYFYKLIAKHFNQSIAFNATIVLMVSLWFSYSRKNIPDVFAASLCIIALYYAFEYLEKGKALTLLIFFILAALGCLSKILAATLLTVLVFPVLNKQILLQRKVVLSLFSISILAVVCWWYFIWVPYLNDTYGFGEHFFMGMSFTQGIEAIIAEWPYIAKRFYDTPLKYSGFAIFLFSIVMVIRKKNYVTLYVFLMPFLSFLILLIKTGASIKGDQYYILTVIPSMAFIIGVGLDYIKNKKAVAFILFIVAVEGIMNQLSDFRIREPYKSLATLENILDGFSKREELIAVNAPPNDPTAMYFAHRKGWTSPNYMLQDEGHQKELIEKGCRYVVIVRQLYGDATLNYPVVYDSEYFKIYKLKDQQDI